MRRISVELLFAGGCSKCAEVREALRAAAESTPGVHWKEIDLAKNPNRAVDLGTLSTPAIAIDGELVFKVLPTAAALRDALRARAARG
jgi:predicted thioredoxin/glutaredoxin